MTRDWQTTPLDALCLGAAVLGLLSQPSASLAQAAGTAGAPAAPNVRRAEPPLRPYQTLVPGLLGRPVFQAADPAGYHQVEIWALLVGPGQRTDEASLPGDAVLLVRSGRGILRIGDRASDLRLGTSAAVNAGVRFRIDNSDDEQAISFRVVVIRSK